MLQNKSIQYLVFMATLILGIGFGCTNVSEVEKQSVNANCSDCFEIVWQTVNERYFDPTFGGLDWNEVHDRYQQLMLTAESDEEFYTFLNMMLFELDVSHVAVIPPDDLEQIDRVLSAEGNIGIDIRLIDDFAVITSVSRGSPGDLAGLRPGYLIQSIDGRTIEQISEEVVLIPPMHERNKRKRITDAVLTRAYGSPGTTVEVTFLDGNDDVHNRSIVHANRPGGEVIDEGLPAFYTEFEARRLNGGIGYIRFNAFLPPVDQKFFQAVESMGDTAGLIIDLRGNHGGVFEVRKALAEKVLMEPTLFWTYERRDETRNVILDPAQQVYKGPIAVLIDALSVSSAEEFSGGLQSIGRAVIVGGRSPGIVVVGEWMQLSNGATFMYPVGQTKTSDGTILEGHGVQPDIEVALDRSSLLRGIDTQLEAAIQYLFEQ